MRRNMKSLAAIAAFPLLAVLSIPGAAFPSDAHHGAEAIKDAQETIAHFKKTDPSMEKLFKNSAGYAVFHSIGKGAIGIGGAGGSGVLFVDGKAIGTTSMAQVTIGLALGGQAYSEVIFFENVEALNNFKGGNFALAAQVSAVAAASGVAANAKYEQGVAVFTSSKGGLMYEASVGGQKFGYEPFTGGKS